MLQRKLLAGAGALALLLSGCSNIKYAVNNDDAAPICFSPSKTAHETTLVKSETHSYFGPLSLLTYNDLIPGWGNPIQDLARHQPRKKRKLSELAIVESWTFTDFGMSLLVNGLGSFVTGGVVSVLYTGSRTSEITAQVEVEVQ